MTTNTASTSNKKSKSDILFAIFGYLIEIIVPILPYIYLLTSIIINFLLYGNKQFVGFFDFEEAINTNLFSTSKLNMLTTISVVLVGFYITVISVFGSSYSTTIEKMSIEKQSQKFMNYASSALVYAFLFLLAAVLYDIIPLRIKTGISIYLLSSMLATCLRFSVIVMMIYNKNIELAAEESKKRDAWQESLISTIKKIDNSINNNSIQKNLEYLDHLRDSMRMQEEQAKPIPEKKKR